MKKLVFVLQCFVLDVGNANTEIFQSLLHSLEVSLHLVMVTATLVGVARLHEFRQHFENFALSPEALLGEVLGEVFQKRIVLDVLPIAPVTCLVVFEVGWLVLRMFRLEGVLCEVVGGWVHRI